MFALLGILALAIAYPPAAPVTGETPRRVTRLADGVYTIEHRDRADGFASGNTTVIIGDRVVFVVDAGFLPSDAREDIAQIRAWTDKPVAFLLDTHFHNDHNFGNRAYRDAFPGITIIAHAEAARDMARYGPGSASRVEAGRASLQRMLDRGKTSAGRALTPEEQVEVRAALARHDTVLSELRGVSFQGATLTFERALDIDLGNRQVQVRFLGRGNTAGDAVVALPKERIVVAGDLVVTPLPYLYDGYPSEWVGTLERLLDLSPAIIVPGHGPVQRDHAYVRLEHDLLKSAVDQLDSALVRIGPALGHTVEEVKGKIDLSPFRTRFAGSDPDIAAAFDAMSADLVQLAFKEASLR